MANIILQDFKLGTNESKSFISAMVGQSLNPKPEGPSGPFGSSKFTLETGAEMNTRQINPWFMSIFKAFAEDKSVSINPAHVQFLLLNAVAHYVNHKSGQDHDSKAAGSANNDGKVVDTMRSKFGIQFDGTQTIVVENNNLVKTDPLVLTSQASQAKEAERYQQEWQNNLDPFLKAIKSKTGPIVEKMSTKLSTATPNDIAINTIAVMSCLQRYFKYEVRTRCGIDTVKLLGTKEDWIALKNIVAEFKNSQDSVLGIWASLVDIVLVEFVNAYSAGATVAAASAVPNVNVAFWKSIVKYRSMSGSNECNGWSLLFFLPQLYCIKKYQDIIVRYFNKIKDDVKALNASKVSAALLTDADVKKYFSWLSVDNLVDLPSGICEVPFIWDQFGTRYKMKYVGGLLETWDANTRTFGTVSNWCVLKGGLEKDGSESEESEEVSEGSESDEDDLAKEEIESVVANNSILEFLKKMENDKQQKQKEQEQKRYLAQFNERLIAERQLQDQWRNQYGNKPVTNDKKTKANTPKDF